MNRSARRGIGAGCHQDAEQAGALQQRHLLVDAVAFDVERRTKIDRSAEIDQAEVRRAISRHQVKRGVIHLRRWLRDVVEMQRVGGFTGNVAVASRSKDAPVIVISPPAGPILGKGMQAVPPPVMPTTSFAA